MASIKSFHDLEIWKLSHQLVLEVYKISKMFPKEESFRITSQLLRASYSIPSNIAEGMGRYTRKEFVNFLTIARGSVEECKYLILLVKDLGYKSEIIFAGLTVKYDSPGKMINSLIL
jgi:four helix bundle protein